MEADLLLRGDMDASATTNYETRSPREFASQVLCGEERIHGIVLFAMAVALVDYFVVAIDDKSKEPTACLEELHKLHEWRQ